MADDAGTEDELAEMIADEIALPMAIMFFCTEECGRLFLRE